MDAPVLATFTGLDALRRFYVAQPDALSDPVGNAAWGEAWAFLSSDTDLVLDETADAVEARIRNGDLIARAVAGSGRGNVYPSDHPARPPERLRLYLGTPARPIAHSLAVTPEEAAGELRRLRKPEGVPLRKGKPIPAALRTLHAPSPGFILVDPYALSNGEQGLEDGVAALLAAMVPDTFAGRVDVMLVCGSVLRNKKTRRVEEGHCPYFLHHFGGDVTWVEQVLGQALARRRPRPHFFVTVVVDGLGLHHTEYHDRHLFAQYVRLNIGRSVDRLIEKGVVRYSTSVDPWSALSHAQRLDSCFWLEKVRHVVQNAPHETVSGPTNHPLFALLAA